MGKKNNKAWLWSCVNAWFPDVLEWKYFVFLTSVRRPMRLHWHASWQYQQKVRLERDFGVSCGVGCAPFRYGVRHCMDRCTVAAQLHKGLSLWLLLVSNFEVHLKVLNQTRQEYDCSYKIICCPVPFRDGMRWTILRFIIFCFIFTFCELGYFWIELLMEIIWNFLRKALLQSKIILPYRWSEVSFLHGFRCLLSLPPSLSYLAWFL